MYALRPTVSSRPKLARHVAGRATEAPSAPQTPVEFEQLVDIIKAVDASDVIEMELKGRKFAMTVKKHEALRAAEPVYIQAPAAMAAPGMFTDTLTLFRPSQESVQSRMLYIYTRKTISFFFTCLFLGSSLRGQLVYSTL
jgi:hypothetical protein